MQFPTILASCLFGSLVSAVPTDKALSPRRQQEILNIEGLTLRKGGLYPPVPRPQTFSNVPQTEESPLPPS